MARTQKKDISLTNIQAQNLDKFVFSIPQHSPFSMAKRIFITNQTNNSYHFNRFDMVLGKLP